jgi:Asp/Glu/hydantoin racemase
MQMLIQPLMTFSVVVIVVTAAQKMSAADSEVSGVFKGNDQPAKIAFVSAHKGSAVAGSDTIKLVFTEKDHSKDQQPDLKALFGD